MINKLINKAKEVLGLEENKRTKDFADCVVFNKLGQFLLVQRKDGTYWLPGGGIDSYDDNHEIAAFRELIEETNLTPEVSCFVCKRPAKNEGTIYVHAILPEDESVVLNVEEHGDFKWVSNNDQEVDQMDILFGSNDLLKELVFEATKKIYYEVAGKAFDNNKISEDDYLKGLARFLN